MKNIYLLIGALLYIGIGTGNAQYTKLLDFNGQNGGKASGSLTLFGNVLYGMANAGGTTGTDGGVVFSIHTDGSGYTNLYNFNGTSGQHPYGSLTLSGNVLYGMTHNASNLYGEGTIFSINTDGSGFTVLHYFNEYTAPYGSLILSGNTLYGMSTYGGAQQNFGNIFSLDIDNAGFYDSVNTGYTELHRFTGPDGSHPKGDLTIAGNVLYGMTWLNGAGNSGTVFSINTDGSGFNTMVDFNGTNGKAPMGSLTLVGNILYGETVSGGINSKGNIFSINTDGSGFVNLFDFDGANGSGPTSRLIPAGNVFYGTTTTGGANGKGNIFSINMDGSGYKDLFDFNGMTGYNANGALTLLGSAVYGLTEMGGNNGNGTIYSFNDVPSASICMVTVDDSSKYNHIIWEKPISLAIDSFIILRETTTNNYQQIGILPYSASGEFVDTVKAKYFPFTGDPNAGTYRYKLQVRDSSGNYSSLSPYHNTLFITQTGGTFNWNPYEIGGQEVPILSLSAYVLYRDDNSSGAWHAIGGVSGTQTTITDPNYTSFPNARWRVETVWGINCSTSASRSNVKVAPVSSVVENLLFGGVTIFPNPANQTISINFPGNNLKQVTLKISNVIGKTVYTEKIENISNSFTKQIDLSFMSKGIYFLEMNSGSNGKEASTVQKIALQ